MFTMVATLYIFRICARFKIYILLRSNVGDVDYGLYYCEVWTRDGEGGAVSMTAHIEPADSNLTSRLEKSMWRPEQQWLFDRRKEGTTLVVKKDFAQPHSQAFLSSRFDHFKYTKAVSNQKLETGEGITYLMKQEKKRGN